MVLTVISISAFLLGILIGAFIVWHIKQRELLELKRVYDKNLQLMQEELEALQNQRDTTEQQIRDALTAKASAEAIVQRIPLLEEQLNRKIEENTRLQSQIAELNKEKEATQEKIQWLETATVKLREAFQSLASEVLQSNADEFLKRTREQLDNILNQVRGDWNLQKAELQKLVEPLEKTLEVMDKNVRQLEEKREGAYRSIEEQLYSLSETHYKLQTTTTTLIQALKSSSIRGSWGEVQLRRVVEMAGLIKNVDFYEQVKTDEGRPDMVVHLPNGGILPVDAKVPMQAYLEAMEVSEEKPRREKLKAHSKLLRQRVQELGDRRYWKQFSRTPEIVVMFVPNEACIGAAFGEDPELFEFAIKNNVLITTPFTLLALLKAVAYGWQQHQVTENAREIVVQASVLYERLLKFIEYLNNIGKGLKRAVIDYNQALGSLESRTLPAARKLKEMGVSNVEIPPLETIEEEAREFTPLALEKKKE